MNNTATLVAVDGRSLKKINLQPWSQLLVFILNQQQN
jgi:hypothetical protein